MTPFFTDRFLWVFKVNGSTPETKLTGFALSAIVSVTAHATNPAWAVLDMSTGPSATVVLDFGKVIPS